jgi:glycosyltransferase involved in cell wall biosynthesis
MRPFIVVQGPVATRSGYGNHSRDLVTSLINADKYDIQIISLPWGVCPMNALEADNLEHQEINKRIARSAINKQPDVFIQISVPNEFQAHGKYNIGITAGIETDLVSSEFLQGCNKMDLILTTSEHSKSGFLNSKFDKLNKDTKQKEGELQLDKAIEVLFEGADTNVYKKLDKIQDTVSTELKDIKDDFCYLFVGHWLKGNIGQDRKDVGMMIKTFCEAFKRKSSRNRPGLILKTSHAGFSIIDRDQITKKIQEVTAPYGNNIPNIYLLHGDLSDTEMNSLYNHPKVKAMVSFTKGEGFGRPLLEFSLTGKPVIASNWSGHTDFLHKDYSTLLPGKLTPVNRSASDQFILREGKWFTVEYGYAAKVLQDVMDNYKLYLNRSRKQGHYSKTEFNRKKMEKLFCEYVDKGLEGVPQQVGLTLPKLKKVNSSPSVTLPKLKKVEA